MTRFLVRAIAIVALLMGMPAVAAPPANISYQGVLRLSNGQVVLDGLYGLRFGIYGSASGGVPQGEQTLSVQITGGLYNVILADPVLIGALNSSSPRFMQVTITGVPVGSGLTPEIVLLPRQQLASVPYALSAPTPPAASVPVAPTVGGTATVQAALESLALAGGAVMNGRFEWADESSVRLAPAVGDRTTVAVDGVLLSTVGSVTFDLDVSGHLWSGNEAPSIWYYCYVFASGGALTPRISSVPPATTEKVGYHPPPNTTWRYVGTFFNNAASSIRHFQARRSGSGWEYQFTDDIPAANVGTAARATFEAIELGMPTPPLVPLVPKTATEVLVRLRYRLTGNPAGKNAWVGHARVIGSAPNSTSPEAAQPRAILQTFRQGLTSPETPVSGWIGFTPGALRVGVAQQVTDTATLLEILGFRD